MKTIKSCLTVLFAAASLSAAFGGTVANAKWGNVGNAADGGLATGHNRGNYANDWSLNFGVTNGICTTEIGGAGVVRISKVAFAARDTTTAEGVEPSKLIVSQGERVITSTSFAKTGEVSVYKPDKTVLTTRTAYEFTFDDETLFDTSESIDLSFGEGGTKVRLGVVQPANTLFQSGGWSPIVEITGDYTPNGAMPLELQHQYSFDGDLEAASGQPLTFQGGLGESYVDSGNGQAYKISSGTASPYGTGILQSGEEAWTIATFAKLAAADNAVVWAIGHHNNEKLYVALTTGTNGQVRVVANPSSADLAAQTLIESSIVVDDRAEKYHLYTITRNNNFLKLYVDGTPAGVYMGAVTLPNQQFQLGQVRGGIDNTGLVAGNDICIDEWRLYQGELSADGVAALSAAFPVWPNDDGVDSVSINFIGGSSNKNYPNGKTIADTETAGVVEVAGAQWNQIIDKGGVAISTNGIPLKEVLKDGSALTGVMTANVQAKCCWNALGNSVPTTGNGQMMYGYLDDGETSDGYGARITVNDIPYSEYTVYVYMGSDTAYNFLTVDIDGISYPLSAQTWYGGKYWGDASTVRENDTAIALTENGNYIKVSGLTNATLSIKGSKIGSYAYDRCGIAGIQIVNTGTRQATGGNYVADIAATPANWNGGNGAGLVRHGGVWQNDNTAAITLTNLTDGATLTFDTDVTAARVNVVQAEGKALTLKATADMQVGAYDFSKNAGKVSVGTDVLGATCALSGNGAKIIPGGTVDFALGENGAMSVSGNGAANGTGVRYTLSSGALSITGGGSSGPFNKSSFTASGSNAVLKLAVTDATGYGAMNNPAFTFEDGAEMQVFKRDTQTTPVVLKGSTVRMMNGCGGDGRGFELFNSNGNNWTVEGASGFVLDPTIGAAGKRVWLHQGDWNVEVKAGGRFDVDVVLYGANRVVKTGAGELYLNGENEWTGGLVIQGGTVYAGGPNALGTGTVAIGEDGLLVFYLDDFATITGAVMPFNFADAASWARVRAVSSVSHPEITYDPATGKVKIDQSGTGVSGLHISSINPKPKSFDPNGHESSIVYLTNYGPDPVNLKDYKLVRTNFGKKVKFSDDDVMPLLDHAVGAGETYAVYLSEDYETASDFGGDGKTVKWFGSAMVVPTKVNPKKYPMVRLYSYAAETNVIDEVVVPCEIDDDITVEVGLNTNKLVRYVVNGTARTEIGPDANGPYGTKDLKNDIELMNARGGFVPTTNDFTVILPVNPLKTGDAVLEPNKIKSVRLEYRFFDKDSMTSAFADMAKLAKGDAGYDKNYGDQWAATIPQTELADKAGRLLQYRAIITDKGGATWTAPRFCHPELGYQWYGAVVQPDEATRLGNLPTMLMFADSVNLVQMDKDVDKQDKTKVPYNARIAIYDTSTHAYYDNVRIDLRGNTSANFNKKSHGLRFSKVAPFTTTNPLDGKKWEVRKSSFCTEYADPTYIRQSLSFWLLNKVGSPAPFHYPVRLYLNGAFYQLAFHTERFTDELIEDVYGLNKFVYSYKNIGTFSGATSAGGIEKKTPDDDNESDLSVLNPYCARLSAAEGGASMTAAQKAALTKTVVTNFDLSAWINYLAIAKITHENDDIWANLSGYIDKRDALHNPDGNDLMAPLAYDMNLSWGQWYYGDDSSAGRCGVRPADDDFKSHPLYGGFAIRAHKVGGSVVGRGNRAVEAVWQNDKFRRLYLRRLRTLMDAWLKEPGTPKEETPFWTEYVEPFKALITASGQDVDEDRTKWNYANVASSASAIWVWNHALTLDEGYDDLWNNYVEPRRQHLFGKHAETNTAWATGYATGRKAGIPAKQSAIADLKAKIGYELVDGGVKITNANGETVDISGWELGGPFKATVPNGTVLDQDGGEVYFVTNRIGWCESHAAEIADQFVVGNVAAGTAGSDVTLKTADGEDVIAPAVKSDQELYLRLWGFCGVNGANEDTDEFIILTNLNAAAALELGGVNIYIIKSGTPSEKCHFTLPAGVSIAAGGFLRLKQADYWGNITNGKVDITITAANTAVIQSWTSVDQDGLGAGTCEYFLVCDYSTEPPGWKLMAIADAPGGDKPTPPPGPSGDVISGDFPTGTNIALEAAGVVRIGNATFGGPLAISGANATIALQEGTVATIPAIAADKALVIDGEGTLVMSNATTLISSVGLTITNGTVKMTYTGTEPKSSAVELKGDYIQYGGAVTMDLASEAQVYGFLCDEKKKVAEIHGGTFKTTIDGGDGSATFKMKKDSNDVTLDGGEISVKLGGMAPRFVNTDGEIKLDGAKVTVETMKGLAETSRVFKCAKTLSIKGGTVTGEATGAGSEMFSSDDTIKVKGGVVSVTSADDCFSAQTNVIISAGKVQALSTAGDAIDSNGDVTISGGYVLANTLAEGELGIEADGALVISGGSVVAVGYENMIHLPDAGSVACYTNGSVKYGLKYVEVAGTNDAHKTILTVNLNKKCAAKFSLVATCPGFIGTVSYTDTKPNKELDYVDKLDDAIDGAFVTTLDIVAPGTDKEMEAETEEEAQKEIAKYEVQLTDEDRQAGVEPTSLKMVAVPVTNETTGAVSYYAKVAVNPETVEVPEVGGAGEDEPIVVTPGEGGTEVSVAVGNATKGLWYGYEVSDAVGSAFANDVPSFKRAGSGTVKVKGSPRSGSASFFRVKVLPAKPTE